MVQLIQDVKPPFTMTNGRMIKKLWERGVTIEEIFGQFYALDAMADNRNDEVFGNDEDGQHGANIASPRKPVLTVGDVDLVGFTVLPVNPLARQPF